MVHYTFNILRRITDVLDKLISGQSGVTQEDIDSIHPSNGCSPDLALFGQMLVSSDEKDAEKKEAEAKTKELDKKRKKAEKAGEEYVEPEESEDDPKLTGGLSFKALNIKSDGALSLNHAFTVHEAQMEIDFFTAVDDLAESGAGHVDTAHYASGLFYLSGSINRELLVKNLQGDVGLAKETMRKYIEAAIKTVPSGKKNSTNPYEWALYTMVELADEAMTHSTAFTEPLNSDRGIIKNAIEALQGWAKAKETCCNLDLQRMEFNLWDKTRDIKSLMDFVSQD
jgi:CRISPR system Cascade subunit CasC